MGQVFTVECYVSILLKSNFEVTTIVKKKKYDFDFRIKQIVIKNIKSINNDIIFKNIDTIIYLPKGQPEQAKEYFLKSVKYKIKNFIYFSSVSVYENYYSNTYKSIY